MRHTILGTVLGLGAALAIPGSASAQSWLPSWSKIMRPRQAAATSVPATASPYGAVPGAYGPGTGNYGQAAGPYGQPMVVEQSAPTYTTAAVPGQAAYGQSPYGAWGGAGGGHRPTSYYGGTPTDTSAPQVDLSGASPYGGPAGAVPMSNAGNAQPTLAPPLTNGPSFGDPSSAAPSHIGSSSGAAAVPSTAMNPPAPQYTPVPTPSVPSAGHGGGPSSVYSAPVTSFGPGATYGAGPSYGMGTSNGVPAYGPAPTMGPTPNFGGPASTGTTAMGRLPGYGGSRSAVNYGSAAQYGAGDTFDQGGLAPDGSGSYETVVPGGAPYGPSYAYPGAYPGSCGPYPPYCGSPGTISNCAPPVRWYEDLTAFYNYSAFKGPLDLDGLNGNFGSRVGLFGAVPVYAPWGIAAQLGSSYGWYDYKGTLYTGDDERNQNFITAGLFQRTSFGLNWGATYDWLLDDYYSDFHFEQVRSAVSYNINPYNEIGVWAAIGTRKDSAAIGTPPVDNTFEPVVQGNLYWRKVWNTIATTNTFIGWCEEPNDFSFGSSAQFALNDFVAVNGGFQYIWPGSGGNIGREEEIWTVSFGLVFYPGSGLSAATSQFRPLLDMPDNGNFAIRRR